MSASVTEVPSPELLDALDADSIRKLLDDENSIRNGLSEATRGHLAAAMESGRYLVFIVYNTVQDGQIALHRHHHMQHLPNGDLWHSYFRLPVDIAQEQAKKVQSQTSVVTVNHERQNNAVSDVGERPE